MNSSIVDILIESKVLALREFVWLHVIFRRKWTMLDYVLRSEAQQCGPARFLQWKRSVFINRNMRGCTIPERTLYFTGDYTRRLEFDKKLLTVHGVYGEIARDVVRTYQNYEFFGSTGKLGRVMLLNILCATAEARPDVGYCQGMNFVAAVLLMGRMPTEMARKYSEDSYSINNDESNDKNAENGSDDGVTGDNTMEAGADRGIRAGVRPMSPAVQHIALVAATPEIQEVEADVFSFLLLIMGPGGAVVRRNGPSVGKTTNSETSLDINKVSADAVSTNAATSSPQQASLPSTPTGAATITTGSTHVDDEPPLTMGGLWKEKMPKMKLMVYQLDRLLKWSKPRLHAHLASIEMSPEAMAAQWFVTLFAYNLPVKITMRIWDFLFIAGWSGIFKVAIAVLGSMEDQLSELDLDGVASMMRGWKHTASIRGSCAAGGGWEEEAESYLTISAEELLRRSNSLFITGEVLSRLQEVFATELMFLAELSFKRRTNQKQKQQQQQQQQEQMQNNKNNNNNHNSSSSTTNNRSNNNSNSNSSSKDKQQVSNRNRTDSDASNSSNNSSTSSRPGYFNYGEQKIAVERAGGASRNGSSSGADVVSNKVTASERISTASDSKEVKCATLSHGISSDSALLPVSRSESISSPYDEPTTPFSPYEDGGNDSCDDGDSSADELDRHIALLLSAADNNILAPEKYVVPGKQKNKHIQLGREQPTFWLLRYGDKLTDVQVAELRVLRRQLRRAEKQAEKDKQRLQSKIVSACETHRDTQEELECCIRVLQQTRERYVESNAEFNEAKAAAREMAVRAALIMRQNCTEGDAPISVASTTNTSSATQASSSPLKTAAVLCHGGNDGSSVRIVATSPVAAVADLEKRMKAGQLTDQGSSSDDLDQPHSTAALLNVMYDDEYNRRMQNEKYERSPKGDRIEYRALNAAGSQYVVPEEENENEDASFDSMLSTGVGSAASIADAAGVTLQRVFDNDSSEDEEENGSIRTTGSDRQGQNFAASNKIGSYATVPISSSSAAAAAAASGSPQQPLRSSAPTSPDRRVRRYVSQQSKLSTTTMSEPSSRFFSAGTSFASASSAAIPVTGSSGSTVPTGKTGPVETSKVSLFDRVSNFSRGLSVASTVSSSSSSSSSSSTITATTNEHGDEKSKSFPRLRKLHASISHAVKSASAANSSSKSGRNQRSATGTSSASFPELTYSQFGDATEQQLFAHLSVAEKKELHMLERQTQDIQTRIIKLQRQMIEDKVAFQVAAAQYEAAKLTDEEALEWKQRVCDQFQRLVEEANRGRSQTLLFVAESYLL